MGFGFGFGPQTVVQGGLAGLSYDLGNQAVNAKAKSAKEELRRADLKRAEVLGHTKATAAASGFELGGSTMGAYLQSMAEEFRKEHVWAEKQIEKSKRAGAWANKIGLFSSISQGLFGGLAAGGAGGGSSAQTTAPTLDSMRGSGGIN